MRSFDLAIKDQKIAAFGSSYRGQKRLLLDANWAGHGGLFASKPAPTGFEYTKKLDVYRKTTVGAGLLAKGPVHSASMLNDRMRSRASYLWRAV
jgi:hypothetical protein